jgi:hypothetical protein
MTQEEPGVSRRSLHHPNEKRGAMEYMGADNAWHIIAPPTAPANHVMKMGSDLVPFWDTYAYEIGDIRVFKGAIVSIPAGWQLCDGTNGTPDLRNSFVIGAGDTYNPDDIGGSATQANHTGHGDHSDHSTHTNDGGHNHSAHAAHDHSISTDGDHSHALVGGAVVDSGAVWNINTNTNGNHDHGGSTANAAAMSHTTDATHNHNAHSSHANNGSISAHGTNLPPYYALAWIERIS